MKPVKTKKRRLSRKKRIIYAKKKGSLPRLPQGGQHHRFDVPLALCSSLLSYGQLVVHQWDYLEHKYGGDRCRTKKYPRSYLRGRFTAWISSFRISALNTAISPSRSSSWNASVTNWFAGSTEPDSWKCPYKVQAPE